MTPDGSPPVGDCAPRVLVAITGGIAAYRAAELVRVLQRAGCIVHAMLSKTATEFIGPATLAALTREPVVVDGPPAVDGTYPHLDASREADLLLIAPATAATLARMATGLAEGVVATTYVGFGGPVLVAPAMNVRMWDHPATRRSMERLVADGVHVVGPDSGDLACGDEGAGRMSQPEAIAARALAILGATVGEQPRSEQRLAGRIVVVTAGGTREPIDEVRWITNRSSGRMGIEIARAARAAGADVRLIVTSGVDPQLYADIEPVAVVEQTTHLADAVRSTLVGSDVLVMAAAVSDFTVAADHGGGKLDRGQARTLELVPTEDIIASVAAWRRGELDAGRPAPALLVGFAAELGDDGLERAREKRLRKGIDVIVHNDVARDDIGFEVDANAVTIIDDAGETIVERAPKRVVATAIVEHLAGRLQTSARPVLP